VTSGRRSALFNFGRRNAAAIVDVTDIAADNMNLRLFPEK
jgi:hypothetical protein